MYKRQTWSKSLVVVVKGNQNGGDLSVVGGSQTFDVPPTVETRDHYGHVVTTEVLSVTATLAKGYFPEAELAGATISKLEGGRTTFDQLLLRDEPNTGPHRLRFNSLIPLGGGLTRYITSEDLVNVHVGPCEGGTVEKVSAVKGKKECGACDGANQVAHFGRCECQDEFVMSETGCVRCPRGQIKVDQRCLCDGAWIVSTGVPLRIGFYNASHSASTPCEVGISGE